MTQSDEGPLEPASMNIDKLMVALAKAQGEIGDIERDRTVKVASSRGGYEFKYATLASLIRGVKKALSANGIAYTHVLSFDKADKVYYLTTSLHYENQFISSVTPLILEEFRNQLFGSALTYMKRYSLAALVGVAPDEDDDGNLADGQEVQAMQQAVNKGSKPKAPAPDPISTGPQVRSSAKEASGTVGPAPQAATPIQQPQPREEHEAPNLHPPVFSPIKIDVVPLDDNNMDWMKWGKEYAAMSRMATRPEQIDELHENNGTPLKNMERDAPRMYANMMLAVVKARKNLEKNHAE